jgi:AcrR family transcriptional regulator
MAVRAHHRLTPGVRRVQLLELGKRHFLNRPYEAISLDQVAEEAGVSKGLLYHYFATKREFYMACLREAVAELSAATEPPLDLPPDEQLRAGLDGYLRYVEEHADAWQAVLRGSIGSDPEVAAIADGFRETMFRRILAAAPEASVPPGLRLAVKGWIGFVEAVSLEWAARRTPVRARLVDLLAGELAHLLDRWSENWAR